MKKRARKKNTKGSPRKTAPDDRMPDLVTAMLKLVERLESLEKKTDRTLAQVTDLRTVISRADRSLAPSADQRPPQNETLSRTGNAAREKILYEAVCADCCKGCKVPFQPSGNRPVYCPECFAIRKAGHRQQDPAKPSRVLNPERLKTVMKEGTRIETLPPVKPSESKKKTGKSSKKKRR
ncbi:MAG: hypothetical protein BWY42_00326 [Candidatus Omnitrophica bacterium ADurb.Bin277]|nr:MAG: hypothetical protein BWY42_00326 [Candidatus Omnitrophica bacterium ADurb.Bin277]